MPRHHAGPCSQTGGAPHVEHPFPHWKGAMRLVIRAIGWARAHAAITLANVAP